MKVLIVGQFYWPENFKINDIAAGLVERGHQVTVLTGMPNYPEGRFFEGYHFFGPRDEVHDGVRILRVPVIARGKSKGLRLLLNYLSFVFFAGLLGIFRCREPYDIIFCFQTSPILQALPGLLIKKIKRIPFVLYVQDLWPESLSAVGAVRSSRKLALINYMVQFIYRQSNHILVQSRGFIQSIMNKGVRREKIHYLPNSAEVLYQPFDRCQSEHVRFDIPSGFCFMFAGNIGVAQDFDTLLKAMEELRSYPDIHLVVIGDGRDRVRAESEAEKRRLKNVHFLGRQPMAQMPYYFAWADILLLSLKDEPIFSLTIPGKLQSYMACARPVLAAINGEVQQIVRESGAGMAVAAESPQALAEAMLAMYHEPESLRQAMGLQARQYFLQHFERERLLDRLEVLLQQ